MSRVFNFVLSLAHDTLRLPLRALGLALHIQRLVADDGARLLLHSAFRLVRLALNAFCAILSLLVHGRSSAPLVMLITKLSTVWPRFCLRDTQEPRQKS